MKILYIHDPRINAKAMEDIVVNPNAIYGFSPDPNSTRLCEYASYDWSDPAVVEAARQERIEYLANFNNQYELWEQMINEGKSTEEIARAVSTMETMVHGSKSIMPIRVKLVMNTQFGLDRSF